MVESWAQRDSPATPEEGRAEKLQNLEHEVFVIKTTIKSLLINIRDSLNDRAYSCTFPDPVWAAGQTPVTSDTTIPSSAEWNVAAKEAALDARESLLDVIEAGSDTAGAVLSPVPVSRTIPCPAPQPGSSKRPRISEHENSPDSLVPDPTDRIQLQKMHQMFIWTRNAVGKFGHDRLAIMLESYRVMGYLTRNKADQIREMSRVMPANPGEGHEVGPDEFVYEIYALNRILAPEDTSFDRDMIEVLLEQREQQSAGRMPSSGKGASSRGSVRDRRSGAKVYQIVEEWINLPI